MLVFVYMFCFVYISMAKCFNIYLYWISLYVRVSVSYYMCKFLYVCACIISLYFVCVYVCNFVFSESKFVLKCMFACVCVKTFV